MSPSDSASRPAAPRRATVSRQTAETTVRVSVELTGDGAFTGSSSLGFLDHMLTLLARHAGIGLAVELTGDRHVDEHHTVEDLAIVLGQAIRQALGDKRGIARYGHAYVPMDETLARAVIDLSGRACLVLRAEFARERVGDLPTELVHDFFGSLTEQLAAAVHLEVLYGRNDHHKIEGLFKAFARALRGAVALDPTVGDRVLSTKDAL